MYMMTNEDEHDFQESSYRLHLDQTIDIKEEVRTNDKAGVVIGPEAN